MKELIKKVLNREVILYLVFGVLTTIVSLGTKYLLLFTIFDASNPVQLQTSVVASWIVACIFAYVTNRIWVFKSKTDSILIELAKFFSARIATLGLEMLIMFIFVTALGLNSDLWVVVWTIVSQALVVISNYFLSKIFVFKNKKNKSADDKNDKEDDKENEIEDKKENKKDNKSIDKQDNKKDKDNKISNNEQNRKKRKNKNKKSNK